MNTSNSATNLIYLLLHVLPFAFALSSLLPFPPPLTLFSKPLVFSFSHSTQFPLVMSSTQYFQMSCIQLALKSCFSPESAST